jgi:hypothetical protein
VQEHFRATEILNSSDLNKHIEGLLLSLNAAEMELEERDDEVAGLKTEKERLEAALVEETKQVRCMRHLSMHV